MALRLLLIMAMVVQPLLALGRLAPCCGADQPRVECCSATPACHEQAAAPVAVSSCGSSCCGENAALASGTPVGDTQHRHTSQPTLSDPECAACMAICQMVCRTPTHWPVPEPRGGAGSWAADLDASMPTAELPRPWSLAWAWTIRPVAPPSPGPISIHQRLATLCVRTT